MLIKLFFSDKDLHFKFSTFYEKVCSLGCIIWGSFWLSIRRNYFFHCLTTEKISFLPQELSLVLLSQEDFLITTREMSFAARKNPTETIRRFALLYIIFIKSNFFESKELVILYWKRFLLYQEDLLLRQKTNFFDDVNIFSNTVFWQWNVS